VSEFSPPLSPKELDALADDIAEARQRRQRLEHPFSSDLADRQISPVLSKQEYDDQNRRYQTPAMGKNEIEPNVVYWDRVQCQEEVVDFVEDEETGEIEFRRLKKKTIERQQIKFLLLPSAVSADAYSKAERAITALKDSDWQDSSRPAAKGQDAKKMSLGWLPQIGGRSKGNKYYNLRSAPTLNLPELYISLHSLLREMDELLRDKLPAYYDYAKNVGMRTQLEDEEDDEIDLFERVKDARHLAYLKPPGLEGLFYRVGKTVFTTIEVNGPTIFRAHEDGHNVDGTCVCIAALGDFVGGRLVFPRYGYSAELRPRDLLICDNNKELHGNLGPLVGERFSVVAFQHESLLLHKRVMKRPTVPPTGEAEK
jgi:hypothetical protein